MYHLFRGLILIKIGKLMYKSFARCHPLLLAHTRTLYVLTNVNARLLFQDCVMNAKKRRQDYENSLVRARIRREEQFGPDSASSLDFGKDISQENNSSSTTNLDYSGALSPSSRSQLVMTSMRTAVL